MAPSRILSSKFLNIKICNDKLTMIPGSVFFWGGGRGGGVEEMKFRIKSYCNFGVDISGS